MGKEDLSKVMVIARDHQDTTEHHTEKGGLVLKKPSTNILKTQKRSNKSKMSG